MARCGVELALVMGGARSDTSLAVSAGPRLGAKAAIAVNCGMRTSYPTRRHTRRPAGRMVTINPSARPDPDSRAWSP